MARLYENLNPIYPEFKSPIPGQGRTCGLSYHEWIEVRAPYGDTDQHVNSLPPIYGDMLIGSQDPNDFEAVLDLALQPQVRESISEGIDGAREIARNYRRDGFLDNNNSAEANKMLNRAEDYLKKANRLQDFWEDAWVANDLAKGWPLETAVHPVCRGKVAPETVKTLTMGPEGATTVEVECMKREVLDDHAADRKLMVELVQAALFNARCAQEVIAAVGTYNRNKKFYEDQLRPTGTELTTDIPEQTHPIIGIKKATIIPGNIPPSTEGPDDSDGSSDDSVLPEPEVGTDTKKKKKKSKKRGGGALIAGAAVLGFLSVKGK